MLQNLVAITGTRLSTHLLQTASQIVHQDKSIFIESKQTELNVFFMFVISSAAFLIRIFAKQCFLTMFAKENIFLYNVCSILRSIFDHDIFLDGTQLQENIIFQGLHFQNNSKHDGNCKISSTIKKIYFFIPVKSCRFKSLHNKQTNR